LREPDPRPKEPGLGFSPKKKEKKKKKKKKKKEKNKEQRTKNKQEEKKEKRRVPRRLYPPNIESRNTTHQINGLVEVKKRASLPPLRPLVCFLTRDLARTTTDARV
jgi:hypothetical protein